MGHRSLFLASLFGVIASVLTEEYFTVDPQSVTAVVGTTNVRLHIKYSNPAIYPYWEVFDGRYWFKILNNASFSGQYWIDSENNDLYIPELKECHAGVFRGAAPGEVYSLNATITVLKTPRLQLCSSKQAVCINSTVTSAALCVITDRNPGVEWALKKYDGSTLVATPVQVALLPYTTTYTPSCQSSTNQNQSTLNLTNSNSLVSGQYLLVANDSLGQRNVSLNITVAGPEAPQISNLPGLITLGNSQSTSILCSVQPSAVQNTGCGGQVIGSGLAVIWTKDGVAVQQDPGKPVQAIQTANGSILVLTSIQKAQTGQYTCLATNSKGSTSANVMVYGSPDPVTDLTSHVEQGVVTFSWTPQIGRAHV